MKTMKVHGMMVIGILGQEQLHEWEVSGSTCLARSSLAPESSPFSISDKPFGDSLAFVVGSSAGPAVPSEA